MGLSNMHAKIARYIAFYKLAFNEKLGLLEQNTS
jgi:hypothetical protein